MTADTPSRVSDQITELRKAATCVYIAVEKTVADDMSRIFSAAAQTIHQQDALTQAQAERIAALEAEVACWKEHALAEGAAANKLLDKANALLDRAEAAESSLAETRAKVEGLEKVAEAAIALRSWDLTDTPKAKWRALLGGLYDALSALPEAKPATQALPDPRNTSAPWQPPIVEKLP